VGFDAILVRCGREARARDLTRSWTRWLWELTLGAIQRLTRGHGLNLVGARYVIKCIQMLDAHRIPRAAALANVDIEHVKV
jgi:hypothetical protein